MAWLSPVPNSIQQGEDAVPAEVQNASPEELAKKEHLANRLKPPTDDGFDRQSIQTLSKDLSLAPACRMNTLSTSQSFASSSPGQRMKQVHTGLSSDPSLPPTNDLSFPSRTISQRHSMMTCSLTGTVSDKSFSCLTPPESSSMRSSDRRLSNLAKSLGGFGSGMSKVSTVSKMANLFGRRHSWNPSEASLDRPSFRRCKSLKLAADASFIRACPLTTVMGNAGHILKPGFQNFGGADLYSRSKEVEQIQDFISHSWRDGRWSKFVALCLLYNGSAGLIASLVYCAVVLVVQRSVAIRFGWGTYKKVLSGQEYNMNEGGCLAFLGAPIVCLGFLYNWMRIRGACEGTRNVFLDRLCIHQTDEDLKRRGILSIGGILKNCDRMVVLWSPAYFFRLWCMFEVAVWCHLDRMDKLVLVPLSKAMLVVAGASGVYLGCMVTLFVHRLGQWQTSTVLSIIMVLAPPAVHCLRALMRDLVALREQLGNVSVTNAECFCCSVNHVCPETQKEIQCDRELIMNTVRELYEGAVGAGEGSAAEKFDHKVRKDFAQQIIANIGGPDAMPMRWCLLIVAPMMWRSADVVSARDLPSPAFLVLVLTQLNFVLETLLVVRVCFFVCGYLANSRGMFVVDYAVSCLGAWACLLLAIGFWAKTYFASQLSVAWPLVVNIFISAMLNLAIFWSEFPPDSQEAHHSGAFRFVWGRKRSSRKRRYTGSGRRDSGESQDPSPKITVNSSGSDEDCYFCQPCSKVAPIAEKGTVAGEFTALPPPLEEEPAEVKRGQSAKPHLQPVMTAAPKCGQQASEEPPVHQPVVTSWNAAKDNQQQLTANFTNAAAGFGKASQAVEW